MQTANRHVPRTERPHVIVISGSGRQGSYTTWTLQEVLSGVEESGGTAELLDLATIDLPPLNSDVDDVGDDKEIAQRIPEANAIILGTPMYHGSYSGVLKNALDYCGFDEFEDTTVGLLAVSGGPFPLMALDHLWTIYRALNAWVLPYQTAVHTHTPRSDGFPDDADALRERVRILSERVVEYARIEPDSSQAMQPLTVGG